MEILKLLELRQEIPYQWRVQSFSTYDASATCVAYIDARDVMNLLDKVLTPTDWQSDFKEVVGQVYGGVAIRVDREWVWKWDTGSESNVEKEKGLASDAFKRAAVKWGIGRFLYDLPMMKVRTNGPKSDQNKYPYVVDDSGKRVYDLTKHCTNLATAKAAPKQEPKHATNPAAKPAAPKGIADKREAYRARILELCDELALAPLLTDEDVAIYIKENTGLDFEPEHYLEIGKKLAALKATK